MQQSRLAQQWYLPVAPEAAVNQLKKYRQLLKQHRLQTQHRKQKQQMKDRKQMLQQRLAMLEKPFLWIWEPTSLKMQQTETISWESAVDLAITEQDLC